MLKLLFVLDVIEYNRLVLENARFIPQRFQIKYRILDHFNQKLYLIGGVIWVLYIPRVLSPHWVLGSRRVLGPGSSQDPWSRFFEGNRPITFHVLQQCGIILKKNLDLKSGDLLFIRSFGGSKKIRELIREEKWKRRKREKKFMLNCSQLSRKSNTYKYNNTSCISPLLVESQLWLQVKPWTGLFFSFQCSLQLCRLQLCQLKYFFKVFRSHS